MKAEYYTVSGKQFKTAYFHYGNQLKIDEKTFPFISRMEILDEVESARKPNWCNNAP